MIRAFSHCLVQFLQGAVEFVLVHQFDRLVVQLAATVEQLGRVADSHADGEDDEQDQSDVDF